VVSLTYKAAIDDPARFRKELLAHGMVITSSEVELAEEGKTRQLASGSRTEMPAFLLALAGRPEVSRLSWRNM
jgi:hypothetical protein